MLPHVGGLMHELQTEEINELVSMNVDLKYSFVLFDVKAIFKRWHIEALVQTLLGLNIYTIENYIDPRLGMTDHTSWKITLNSVTIPPILEFKTRIVWENLALYVFHDQLFTGVPCRRCGIPYHQAARCETPEIEQTGALDTRSVFITNTEKLVSTFDPKKETKQIGGIESYLNSYERNAKQFFLASLLEMTSYVGNKCSRISGSSGPANSFEDKQPTHNPTNKLIINVNKSFKIEKPEAESSADQTKPLQVTATLSNKFQEYNHRLSDDDFSEEEAHEITKRTIELQKNADGKLGKGTLQVCVQINKPNTEQQETARPDQNTKGPNLARNQKKREKRRKKRMETKKETASSTNEKKADITEPSEPAEVNSQETKQDQEKELTNATKNQQDEQVRIPVRENETNEENKRGKMQTRLESKRKETTDGNEPPKDNSEPKDQDSNNVRDTRKQQSEEQQKGSDNTPEVYLQKAEPEAESQISTNVSSIQVIEQPEKERATPVNVEEPGEGTSNNTSTQSTQSNISQSDEECKDYATDTNFMSTADIQARAKEQRAPEKKLQQNIPEPTKPTTAPEPINNEAKQQTKEPTPEEQIKYLGRSNSNDNCLNSQTFVPPQDRDKYMEKLGYNSHQIIPGNGQCLFFALWKSQYPDRDTNLTQLTETEEKDYMDFKTTIFGKFVELQADIVRYSHIPLIDKWSKDHDQAEPDLEIREHLFQEYFNTISKANYKEKIEKEFWGNTLIIELACLVYQQPIYIINFHNRNKTSIMTKYFNTFDEQKRTLASKIHQKDFYPTEWQKEIGDTRVHLLGHIQDTHFYLFELKKLPEQRTHKSELLKSDETMQPTDVTQKCEKNLTLYSSEEESTQGSLYASLSPTLRKRALNLINEFNYTDIHAHGAAKNLSPRTAARDIEKVAILSVKKQEIENHIWNNEGVDTTPPDDEEIDPTYVDDSSDTIITRSQQQGQPVLMTPMSKTLVQTTALRLQDDDERDYRKTEVAKLTGRGTPMAPNSSGTCPAMQISTNTR